jgi:hypothetical protein
MVFSTWLPFIRKSGWQKYPNGIFDLAAVHQEKRMAEIPEWYFRFGCRSAGNPDGRNARQGDFDLMIFHQKGRLEKKSKNLYSRLFSTHPASS